MSKCKPEFDRCAPNAADPDNPIPVHVVVDPETNTSTYYLVDGSEWSGDPATLGPCGPSTLNKVDADGSSTNFSPSDDCLPSGAFQRIVDHHDDDITANACSPEDVTLHRSLVIGDDHVRGTTGVGGAKFIGVSSMDSNDADTGAVTTHHKRTVISSSDSRSSGDRSIAIASARNLASGVVSIVAGGLDSTASGFASSVIASDDSDATANHTGVYNSKDSLAAAERAVVISSDTATATDSQSTVISSLNTNVTGPRSSSISSTGVTVNSGNSSSVAVINSTIADGAETSGIFAGRENTIDHTGNAKAIVGSLLSDIAEASRPGQSAVVIAGSQNVSTTDAAQSVIVASNTVTITDANNGFIAGSLGGADVQGTNGSIISSNGGVVTTNADRGSILSSINATVDVFNGVAIGSLNAVIGNGSTDGQYGLAHGYDPAITDNNSVALSGGHATVGTVGTLAHGVPTGGAAGPMAVGFRGVTPAQPRTVASLADVILALKEQGLAL